MNAVDTNVFVYALDADEPVKQAKALDLFQRLTPAGGSTILLWQVAAELLSNLRKRESAPHGRSPALFDRKRFTPRSKSLVSRARTLRERW
jgi:predicted nucleic acid-binding protein